jgi:TctA family transporter
MRKSGDVLGTASLVFGLILIGFGLLFGLLMFVEMIQGANQLTEDVGSDGFGPLIIVVALFAVGGLLIRSFDKDRKKEKNS